METKEEELGGGTTFCGRVFGFWPPAVALEILQPAPLFIVHKLALGSVWLPKIACKEKEKVIGGELLHHPWLDATDLKS